MTSRVKDKQASGWLILSGTPGFPKTVSIFGKYSTISTNSSNLIGCSDLLNVAECLNRLL